MKDYLKEYKNRIKKRETEKNKIGKRGFYKQALGGAALGAVAGGLASRKFLAPSYTKWGALLGGLAGSTIAPNKSKYDTEEQSRTKKFARRGATAAGLLTALGSTANVALRYKRKKLPILNNPNFLMSSVIQGVPLTYAGSYGGMWGGALAGSIRNKLDKKRTNTRRKIK